MYNPLERAREALDMLLGSDRDDDRPPTDTHSPPGVSAEPASSPDDDGELDLKARLSHLNGAITRLSTRALHAELVRFGCDVTGDIAVRRARLKRTVRNLKAMALDDVDDATSAKDPDVKALRGIRRDLAAADVAPRYICVVDFECTCEENATDFPHEIIEFPVVVIDRRTREVVGEFSSFCRPELNPVLSPFCTALTGITQAQVDAAPTFPEVLVTVEKWLSSLGIGDRADGLEPFHLATDGPWDVHNFLTLQCCFSRLTLPRWAGEWINLRKHAHNFYHIGGGVSEMLIKLGMEFEGREHSGIDDTRNIARIAIQLLRDGHPLNLNDTVAGASTAKTRRFENGGRPSASLPPYQHGAIPSLSPWTPVPVCLPPVVGGGADGGAAAGAAVGDAVALFCDLDGVLADFDAGILKLTGRTVEQLPVSQLWKAVSRCKVPRGFFGSLEWTPDGRHLWDAIKHCSPTVLTGCPSSDTEKAAKQKRSWCARHLGEHVNVITCMSREKHEYIITTGVRDGKVWRSPVSVLIDDRERARKPWEAAGGVFVLHRNTTDTLAALAEIAVTHRLAIFGSPSPPPPPSS